MDAIPPTSATLRSLSSASTGANTAQIAGDLDEFLVLLTAQLENQDPLNPMDPSQFTDQLTQLSQLEQAAAQTDELQEVNAALSALTARADAGFLGRRVETTTDSTVLVDGEARITVALDEPAERIQVEVLNAAGLSVATLDADGTGGVAQLVWNGRDRTGTVLADGVYTVRATAGDGAAQRDARVLLSGVVEEIRFTQGGAYMRLDSGLWAPLDQTRALTAASG